MKLILHAGMPKAGSSALQRWMQAHRATLSEEGIIYPKAPIMPHNHHILLAGCVEDANLPRILRHKSAQKGQDVYEKFHQWLTQLKQLSEQDHDLMILSSESLFNMDTDEDGATFRRLAEYLNGLFDEIRVAIYVRKPSRFYLSSCQQIIKASHQIRAPEGIPYRRSIELLEKHLSATADVHLYDSVHDYHRGIVEQFGAFYDDRIHRLASQTPATEKNPSFSCEGMHILHLYRQSIHSKSRNVFTHDTNSVISALSQEDSCTDGFERPRLFPNVAEHVDESSVDLLWLRDRFGVKFSDVNYDRIKERPKMATPKRIDDICPVDHARAEILTMRVMHSLALAPIVEQSPGTVPPTTPPESADTRIPLLRRLVDRLARPTKTG